MNRRAALVLSVAIAVVAILVGWLAFGWKMEPTPAANAAERVHSGANANQSGTGASLGALDGTALEAVNSGVERARVVPDSHDAATPVDDSELATASFVEGRLELAEGTPLDEEAWVVARGREFERRPLHRARVAPDGHFRVAFAAGTQLGWLQLAARYNYLDDSGGIRPDKPPKDVVLKGRLGGCVRGRILLPPDAQEFVLDLRRGRVSGGNENYDFFGFQRTEGSIHEDLSYEVGGLEPGAARSLMLKAHAFVDVAFDDVEITKGGVTLRDLSPALGSRISGRVVAKDGAVLADVKVKPTLKKDHPFQKDDSVKTDAAGRFELVGLAGGDLAIVAQKSGFEPTVRALGETPAGTRRQDLELVLDTGLTIAGVVKFAGGGPAARALVALEDLPEPGAPEGVSFEDPEPIEADAAGLFRVSGLRPGSYTLTAKAWVDPERDVETAPAETGDKPRKVRKRGTPWSARLERVPAGTSEIAVTLTKGDTISGRVLDSEGKPVERFSVNAYPDHSSPGFTSEIEGIERAFRDKDGRFALEGLRACGWSVHVSARGLLDSSSIAITVPGPNQSLAFKLLRLAKLSGVVLGADRKPVERAKVSCVGDSPGWRYDSRRATVRTNEKGEFTLQNAPLGPVRLQTEAPGYAPSVPLRFEIGPSAVRTGLELVLTKGGSIRGVVVKDDGSKDAGRPVNLTAGDLDKRATSDAQGEFAFELLPPGTYSVATTESREETMKRYRARSEESLAEIEEVRHLRTTVDVRDGETVTVKLGGAPPATIGMHGKVVAPGVKGLSVVVAPFVEDGSDSVHRAEVAEDGMYALRLRSRGSRKVTVMDASSTTLAVFRVDIPPGADFERNFVVTSGRISGRVVDAEGTGVGDVRVRAIGASHRDLLDEVGRRETKSASDGTFEFERLADGTYTVETDGREQWWNDAVPDPGSARVEGVVLKDAKAVEGLELVLREGGEVTGSVRGASGELMPGVEVFAFDSSGHRFASNRGLESDSGARFSISHAPEGRILLYARTPNSAGKATAVVRGDTAIEVDIVLHPRADLDVLVQDAGGAAIFAGLEIVDEDGRHFEEVPQVSTLSASAAGARSFTGLPAGQYRVRAFGASASIGEKQVRTNEGARAEVVLRTAQ